MSTVTIALVVAGGIGAFAVTPAAAATTTQLVTGTSSRVIANTVATSLHPGGSDSVVIAQDSDIAVLSGATLAARTDSALLVSGSGTSTAELDSKLQALGTTKTTLVSTTADYFTTAFDSGLAAAGVQVLDEHNSSDPLTLSMQTAAVGSPTEYAFANIDEPAAAGLALSYAMTRGVPIVTWSSSSTNEALADAIQSLGDVTISIFGNAATLRPVGSAEEYSDKLSYIETSDPTTAFLGIVTSAEGTLVRTDDIVAAPSDRVRDFAIAGLMARKNHSLLAPAGTASNLVTDSRTTEYLKFLKNETHSLTLVGANLTTANLTTLASPTNQYRPAAPSFRVTNFVRNTSNYTLTVTAVSGATKYQVFDMEGAAIGTSTSPTITVTGDTTAAVVVASKSTGTLATIDVRTNEYTDSSLRRSAVIGSVGGGSTHLVFLNGVKTPRLITRVTSDPFNMAVEPTPPTPVAVTCGSSYTESGLDATKQYTYSIMELTNVNSKTCDDTAALAVEAAQSNVVMELPLPFTQYPAGMEMATLGAVEKTTKVFTPKPTIMDLMITGAMDDSSSAEDAPTQQSVSSSKTAVVAGAGDDWSDFLIRYMAFIPESKIPAAGAWDGSTTSIIAFGGDGHSPNNPNGSFRFRQDLRFYFGSDHKTPSYTEAMGQSHSYNCSDAGLKRCSLIGSATAPLSQLSLVSSSHGATSGTAKIKAAATLPLLFFAPPIDQETTFRLRAGGSTFTTYHDNMPKHEIFVGVPYSEWYRVYSSPYWNYSQLPCLFSSPAAIKTSCSSRVNGQL